MYDFRCKSCGHKFTVLVSISDRDKVTCPECRSGKVEQLISACTVRVGSCGGGSVSTGGGG